MSTKSFNSAVQEVKNNNTAIKSTQNVPTENTANSEKQPKAERQVTKEVFRIRLNSYLRVIAHNFDKLADMTNNGALKITSSLPECRADVKKVFKLGTKSYYAVPTGETRVSVSSFISYCEDVAALAERQKNFPTFADWCEQSTQKAKITFAVDTLGLDKDTVLAGLKKQYEEKKKELFG